MKKIVVDPAQFFIGHVSAENKTERYYVGVRYCSTVRLRTDISQLTVDGVWYNLKDTEEAERVFKAVTLLIDSLNHKAQAFLETIASEDGP